MSHKPPSWIIKLCESALKVMNLERWDLGILWESGMTRTAEIAMQLEYETADIKVSKEMDDDRHGHIAVVHEVCHLQHAPIYIAMDYVLELIPEGRDRDLAKRMFKEADELVTQRECMAWLDVLNAAAKPKIGRNIHGSKGLANPK